VNSRRRVLDLVTALTLCAAPLLAVDLVQIRTTLTGIRSELDADQPNIKASLDAINLNRLAAYRDFWATSGLAKIQDGTSNTLAALPQSPLLDPARAKLADFKSAIAALDAANRKALADWSAAYSAFQTQFAQVPALHSQFGDLAQRVGTDATVATKLETTTGALRTKLAAIDADEQVAETTGQFQLAAWQRVVTVSNDLAAALNAAQSSGNFGSTPMGGGDMVQKMAAMNLAFLKLQEAVQLETRRYRTLSSTSKARHDSALTVIKGIGG
jgi:hypothetical protein